jgi:hypothetical protein
MWKESLTSFFEVLSWSFTGTVVVSHAISQVEPTYESVLSRMRNRSISKMTMVFFPENMREVFEFDVYSYQNNIVYT